MENKNVMAELKTASVQQLDDILYGLKLFAAGLSLEEVCAAAEQRITQRKAQ